MPNGDQFGPTLPTRSTEHNRLPQGRGRPGPAAVPPGLPPGQRARDRTVLGEFRRLSGLLMECAAPCRVHAAVSLASRTSRCDTPGRWRWGSPSPRGPARSLTGRGDAFVPVGGRIVGLLVVQQVPRASWETRPRGPGPCPEGQVRVGRLCGGGGPDSGGVRSAPWRRGVRDGAVGVLSGGPGACRGRDGHNGRGSTEARRGRGRVARVEENALLWWGLVGSLMGVPGMVGNCRSFRAFVFSSGVAGGKGRWRVVQGEEVSR